MGLDVLALQELKELRFFVDGTTHLIRAGSGLLKLKDTFYVIADDELSLAAFSLEEKDLARFFQLAPGQLPTDPVERKKQKPDWEALASLALSPTKDGILVVPSGSKKNRQKGFFLEFEKGNLIAQTEIDFSPLFQKLTNFFSELNIEGAAITAKHLVLFQRGNGPLGQNAAVYLEFAGALKDIRGSNVIQPDRILEIRPFDLGKRNDTLFSFTDACPFYEHIFFLAVAEKSPSTYEDGEYLGSYLGLLNQNGEFVFRKDLDCPFKPEGLWVEKVGQDLKCYIVTDADSPNQVSYLYLGSFPLEF